MKPFVELLLQIEKRPGMFGLVNGGEEEEEFQRLEFMFHGYQNALKTHGVTVDFQDFNSKFGDFLFRKEGWSTSCGWAAAICSNVDVKTDRQKIFFQLCERFLHSEGELKKPAM